MATFLDIGIIEKMNFLFPFLLVFILVFVVLLRLEMFKEKQIWAVFIALILALITLTSSMIVKTINKMAPWFILLIVFGILVLIVYQAMGIKEKAITDVLTGAEHGPAFVWWIVALVVLIGVGSFVTVYSEEKGFLKLTDEGVEDDESSFWSSLLHPKLLGLVLLFLVAYFTIQKMTSTK